MKKARFSLFFKRARTIIAINSVLVLTIVGFQNCGEDVKFSNASSSGDGSLSLPDGGLKLNDGALFTNNLTVEATIAANALKNMTMSLNNADCSSLSPDATTIWDRFAPIRSWLLADSDGDRKVTLFLRSADGKTSPCIEAQITLDRVAPLAVVEAGPAKFTQSTEGDFKLKSSDDRSGIEKMMCRVPGKTDFAECSAQMKIENLKEGNNSVAMYAVDRAGNKSNTVEHSWMIDLTVPTAKIQMPFAPAVSFVNTASIYFEGVDKGSGVDHFVCYLNATLMDNCTSPVNLQNLTDGNYVFRVKAIDKVGWESIYAESAFKIDTQPSGDFRIMGLSGGKDMKIDNYLTDLAMPTVNWSLSDGSQSYRVQILSRNKDAVVCGPVNVNDGKIQSYTFAAANCPIIDGGRYWARVSAFRNAIEKPTDDFSFQADASGPVITILNIVTDDEKKTAHVDFTITDTGSGVKTATCYKEYKADTQQVDCTNLTSIDYSKLGDDDHTFKIYATDVAGNMSMSTPAKITIKSVVCDPFGTAASQAKCEKGLKSNLYYASADDRTKGNNTLSTLFSSVGKLIKDGVKSNTVIYLPYLDVPLRAFTDGFGTTDGKFLTDNGGQKLDEWFALELTSFLKLGDGDPEGYYQLVVTSDDGSNLWINANNSTNYSLHIDNDGVHANKVGCPAKGAEVYMTKTTRLPIKIEYYQGPRTQIAMTLHWRKVTSAGSDLSANCGFNSSSDSDWYSSADKKGVYQKLKDEGFTSPRSQNFISK